MLIPRFSIRWLLVGTTVCAVFFLIVSLGVRGYLWAAAVSIAVGSLLLVALLQMLFFIVVWSYARLVDVVRPAKQHRSPFAPFTPPPQLIAPEDPE
jgi:amino acid transporter